MHNPACSAHPKREQNRKGDFTLQQQNNQNQMQSSHEMPAQQQIGGHELFDADEAIGTLVGSLEQNLLYENQIQDSELKGILQSQQAFMSQLYNTIVETFKTGQKPTVSTQVYNMSENNKVTYGLKESQPKKPAQSVQEINDECITTFMLGNLKACAGDFTLAALEATNPILRRVFADSIPNIIEMAYEIFLYQNKNGYYQVPQLEQNDMMNMLNTYAPIQNKTH